MEDETAPGTLSVILGFLVAAGFILMMIWTIFWMGMFFYAMWQNDVMDGFFALGMAIGVPFVVSAIIGLFMGEIWIALFVVAICVLGYGAFLLKSSIAQAVGSGATGAIIMFVTGAIIMAGIAFVLKLIVDKAKQRGG